MYGVRSDGEFELYLSSPFWMVRQTKTPIT